MEKQHNAINNRLFITFILFMAVTFLSALPALAGDFKRYSGDNAVRTGGTANPSYTLGSIANPGNGGLHLNLPVANDSGSGIQSGTVIFVDQNPNADASCTFYSLYRSTFIFHGWWSPPKKTSGAMIVPQKLQFPDVHGNSLTHYLYKCSLPPKHNGKSSSVISYSVTEK